MDEYTEEETQVFSNGDKVKFLEPWCPRDGVIYEVSGADEERGKCWVGDPDDSMRGWYAFFSQLQLVEDEEEEDD